MIKKILKKFEIYFVNFFLSFGVALLVGVLCSIPIRLIRTINSDIGYFALSIVVTVIRLFISSYKEGYRHREFQLKLILISVLLLLCLQIILVLIIGHAVYITGPTVHLANYILYRINPELINGKVILSNTNTLLMILAFFIIYSPTMILGEYIGVKTHRKDFANQKTNY